MNQLRSFNPATGELVGSVGVTAPGDVQRVVAEVAEVQPFWSQLGLEDRGRYLRRAAQAIVDMTDELVELIAREQGKPRTSAYLMEVLPTIDALHWMAGEGPEVLADERIATPQPYLKTKRSAFTYDPLGVIGVIAPWNYPWSIPLQEVGMALMAGNGVVLKPASLTPLIYYRVMQETPPNSLALAWRLYQDSSRDLEVVERTDARNPGFLPFTGRVLAPITP